MYSGTIIRGVVKIITSEERVIKAIKHEEIDRVPTFEWLIDKKVIDGLYPGLTYEEFVYKMDLDAICFDRLDYKVEQIGENLFRDEWGMVKQKSDEEHTVPVSGPIKTLKDLDSYIPPDPDAPERYLTFEKCLENNKGRKAVILHLNDVFSIPSRLMTFEDFMVSIIDEPSLVEGLIDMTIEVNLKMAKQAVKRGLKIIYTGDDFAYNSGPMMNPKVFNEIFAPRLKKVMNGYKDLGLLVIKHTDGNIKPILEPIIESGIDCLDPIDPIAGMDLAEMKRKYGKKISLKGNVDCSQTLTFGSVEETIEETKRCISIAAPGSGYILSSSNSIHSKVKPENFMAMIDTVKEFGAYPIRI